MPATQSSPASPMQLLAAIGLQECAPAPVRVAALEWMAAMAATELPDGEAVESAAETVLSCSRTVLAAAAAGSARVRAAAGGAAAALAEAACRSCAGRAVCAQVGHRGSCPVPCLLSVPVQEIPNLPTFHKTFCLVSHKQRSVTLVIMLCYVHALKVACVLVTDGGAGRRDAGPSDGRGGGCPARVGACSAAPGAAPGLRSGGPGRRAPGATCSTCYMQGLVLVILFEHYTCARREAEISSKV